MSGAGMAGMGGPRADARAFAEAFFALHGAALQDEGPRLVVGLPDALHGTFGTARLVLTFDASDPEGELVAPGSRVFDLMAGLLAGRGRMARLALPAAAWPPPVLRPWAGVAEPLPAAADDRRYLVYDFLVAFLTDERAEEGLAIALDDAGREAPEALALLEAAVDAADASPPPPPPAPCTPTPTPGHGALTSSLTPAPSLTPGHGAAASGLTPASPLTPGSPAPGCGSDAATGAAALGGAAPEAAAPEAAAPGAAAAPAPAADPGAWRHRAEAIARAHAERRAGAVEAAAAGRLAAIAGRLRAYYEALASEVPVRRRKGKTVAEEVAEAEAERGLIAADLARRLAEEARRHQLVVQVRLLGQATLTAPGRRFAWRLTAPDGRARLVEARQDLHAGATAWPPCERCAAAGPDLGLCAEGHLACPGCLAACPGCGAAHCAPELDACACCGARRCPRCLATCPGLAAPHRACPDHLAPCPRCGIARCPACQPAHACAC